MNVTEVSREAIRNLTSRHTKPALTLLIFLLIIGVPLAADQISMRNIMNEQQRFLESGATIYTYQNTGEISGHYCENLDTTPGIASAGALRQSENLSLDVMPDHPVSSFEATQGALTTLIGSAPTDLDGIFLPHSLAEHLGVHKGDTLSTRSGDVKVAGIYPSPEDGRDPSLSWVILSPTLAQGAFDSCWTDVREQVDKNRLAALSASSTKTNATDAPPTVVKQLNTHYGAEFDAEQKVENRIGKYTPAVTSGALAIALFAFVYSRRVEISANLHLGMTHRALLLQLTVEYGILLFTALCLLAAGLFASDATPALLTAAAQTLIPAIPAAACGLICGVTNSSATRFYTYFRDRK